MDIEDKNDQDLSELYEDLNFLGSSEKPKKRGNVLTIPVLLLILCLGVNIFGLDISIGDIISVLKTEGNQSVEVTSKGVDTNISEAITTVDDKLKEGELLSDVVKNYFKSEYGLDITIVDTVDATDGVEDDNVLKVITVKDIDSGSAYEFRYDRVNGVTNITDTYGSTLTSKLLGAKLTEYYKDKLPEGSTIWVDSESLGMHSSIENSDIANKIMNLSLDELLLYTDEVKLFRGIGLNIVESEYKEEVEENYVLKYKDLFQSIDELFSVGGVSPKLEVVFLKGEEGKLNVLSYLEQKIGLTTVGGSFFIDWYSEIPLMGMDANTNIIGAMSIKNNITDVLNNYINNNLNRYFDEVSNKYIEVYSSVDNIMLNSIEKEKRNLVR